MSVSLGCSSQVQGSTEETRMSLFYNIVMATTLLLLDWHEVVQVAQLLEHDREALLDAAARRYARYTRQRYIALSGKGGGQWPNLAEATIKSKISRGIAENPEWILREYDELIEAIGVITRKDYKIIGIARNTTHSTGKSIGFIAKKHQRGTTRMPRRPIFIKPDESLRMQMTEDVRKELRRRRGKSD